MEKNRLEAFSDGVIAIVLTIMVLDLKVPHDHITSARFESVFLWWRPLYWTLARHGSRHAGRSSFMRWCLFFECSFAVKHAACHKASGYE